MHAPYLLIRTALPTPSPIPTSMSPYPHVQQACIPDPLNKPACPQFLAKGGVGGGGGHVAGGAGAMNTGSQIVRRDAVRCSAVSMT